MKHISILLILLLNQLVIFSQDWEWAEWTGDKYTHTFSEFCETDNQGNVYVAGEFSTETISFGTHTLTNKGRDEIFIVKYNPQGTVVWAHAFGGSRTERIEEMVVAGNNSIFLCGSYSSSDFSIGEHALPLGGRSDGFYLQLDLNGEYIDHFCLSTPSSESIKSIKTQGHDIVIGGEFSAKEISFGSHTLSKTDDNTTDFFLAKKSQNNWQWARSNGGAKYDKFIQLALDRDGNIYTAVMCSDTLTFKGKKYFYTEEINPFLFSFSGLALCLKYDSNGNEISAYQNSKITTIRGISCNPTNHIDLIFEIIPEQLFSLRTSSKNGIIVLDENLFVKQSFTFSQISDIDYDEKGNIYVSSSSFANITKIKPDYSSYERELVKSTIYDQLNGIAVTGENQIFITGSYSTNPLLLDTIILPNTNNQMLADIDHGNEIYRSYKNMFIAKNSSSFEWDQSEMPLISHDFIYEFTDKTIELSSMYPYENYIWDFGDGFTSNEASPSHTYVADGIYTVCFSTNKIIIDSKYFLYKRCKEVAVGDFTGTTQPIKLKEGWNLVSTNLAPTNSKIDVLFAPIMDEIEQIKNYDAFFDPNIDIALNTLQEIESGEGYLIKMKSYQTLTISGYEIEPSEPSLELKSGWNIIGIHSQETTTIDSALSPYIDEIKMIKGFDGDYKIGASNNSLTKLEPSKAYFIKL